MKIRSYSGKLIKHVASLLVVTLMLLCQESESLAQLSLEKGYFVENSNVTAFSSVADSAGNVYTIGTFAGWSDLNPKDGTALKRALGKQDGFITKLGPNGEYLWTKTLGGTDSTVNLAAVAVASDGSILVFGNFDWLIDADPGAAERTLTSTGQTSASHTNFDCFLLNLSSEGEFVRVHQIKGPSTETAWAISVDASTNITIVGTAQGTIDFGSEGVSDIRSVPTGYVGLFSTKMHSDFSYSWTTVVNMYSYTSPSLSMANDSTGAILIAGRVYDSLGPRSIDFDPSGGVDLRTVRNAYEMFITKYNADGSYAWTTFIAGTESSSSITPKAIAVTPDNSIVVGGSFSKGTMFNPADPSFITTNYATSPSNAFIATYNFDGTFAWLKAFGGTMYLTRAVVTGLIVRADGKIIASGEYDTEIDMNPGGAPVNYTCKSWFDDVFVNRYSASGAYEATMMLASITESKEANSKMFPVDNQNFLLMATTALLTTNGAHLDLDPGAGAVYYDAAGKDAQFLAKYGYDNSYKYHATWAGTGNEGIDLIKTDAQGNVFTFGRFSGLVNFDQTGGHDVRVGHLQTDIFITKTNADGSYGWTRTFGDYGFENINDVALDSSGNLYLTGQFNDQLRIDPSPSGPMFIDTGYGGIYMTKFTNDGDYVWSQAYTGGSFDWGVSVAVDHNDDIIFVGAYTGTYDFDPGPGTDTHGNGGGSCSPDINITKLHSDGSYMWTKSLNGVEWDEPQKVVVDSQNNIYVTGWINTSVDFDPSGAVYTLTSLGNLDSFLAKYNQNGEFLWVRQIGGTGKDQVSALTLDADENPIIGGSFQTTVNFDAPLGSDIRTGSDPNNNAFLTKFNKDGTYGWTKTLTGGRAVIYDLSTGSNGHFVAAGKILSSNVDFDPGPGVDIKAVSSGAFITEYNGPDYQWSWLVPGSANSSNTYALVRALFADPQHFYVAGTSGSGDIDPTCRTLLAPSISSTTRFGLKLARAYTLTGTTTLDGQAVPFAKVDGGIACSAFTDGSGVYRLVDIPVDSDVSVVASKFGFTFTPNPGMRHIAGDAMLNFTATATTVFSVSGYAFSTNGTMLQDVTVHSDSLGDVVTDSNGYFSFAGLALGTAYSIIPSLTGYNFAPSHASGVISSNVTLDFVGTPLNNVLPHTFTISGTAKIDGDALPGVTIDGGALGQVTTNSQGQYLFSGIPEGTNYTLIPSLDRYTLKPTSVSSTLVADAVHDFAATGNAYNIEGTVLYQGSGLSGVTIAGGALGSKTSNSNGAFVFSGVLAGSRYQLTPSAPGYVFNPIQESGTLVANTSVTFVAQRSYTISGIVTESGSPLTGVRVGSLETGFTTTNSSGQYTLAGLLEGSSYNILPQHEGITINPLVCSGKLVANRVCDFEYVSEKPLHGKQVLAPWNGFLGNIVIAEVLNTGNTALTVTLTLYSMNGNSAASSSAQKSTYQVEAGEHRDVIVNDLPGFEQDRYGVMSIEFSHLDYDGQVSYYKLVPSNPYPTGEKPQNDFDYVLTNPFHSPIMGTSHVIFNTYQPSTKLDEATYLVPNWLTIINGNSRQVKYFRVRKYGASGNRIPLETALGTISSVCSTVGNELRCRVSPMGRIDIDGGHVTPGPENTGTIEIVPEDAQSPYSASLVRYGMGAAPDQYTDRYSFGTYFRSEPVSFDEMVIPLSVGANAAVVVELANVTDQKVGTTLVCYDYSGKELKRESIKMLGRSVQHFDFSTLYGINGGGQVVITSATGKALIAHALQYFRKLDGSIASVVVVQAERMTMEPKQGSYNTYLGMENWLQIVNESDQKQTVTLSLSNGSTRASKVRKVTNKADYQRAIPAHGGIVVALHDSALFETKPDSIGMFTLNGANPDKLVANVLRLKRISTSELDFAVRAGTR